MRPKNLILPLLCGALLVCESAARAAMDTPPAIVIDGSRLPSDVPALMSGDRVLVPLRGVLEQFGASVGFDEASGTATATLGGTKVEVTVGSRQARVNGETRVMDVAAREVAGRVMIPLRFVSEALGVSVDYDEQSNTVVIVSGFRPGSFAAYGSGPVFAPSPHVSPSVENERPGSNEIVGTQYPTIYARFAGGTSAINPSTVQIQVDGIDVTDAATVSSAYVSYTPSTPLSTGLHNVYITGQADDGTPFTESWSFRVDAGESSDYTVGSYGGGFGPSEFGFPRFRRFGFFPPGFSVFTPGPLFFVNGGVIEVIFISRFFPFGNAFFTISGCPGTFLLTPWLGNPGFFWGFMQVPPGLHAHDAVIAAHFTMPNGKKVVVHSTAPLQIEGNRKSLPSDLHYAVLPRIIGRPRSPRQLVVFQHLEPRLPDLSEPIGNGITVHPHIGTGHFDRLIVPIHQSPSFGHTMFGRPAIGHEFPAIHPVITPHVPMMMPAFHPPQIAPWQMPAPARPVMPAIHPPGHPK